MAQVIAADRVGKRSGAVQFEHFQKEDYQKKLDGIIESVNGSLDGFKFDRKGLASTLAGLLQFMEDALGVKALNKQFPKVPAKLFNDFAADGPLATIARLCGAHMKSKGQKKIDWSSPATRKENTDLVLRIRQELLRAGHIRLPRIFVQPDCPNAPLLRHTITKMGGELAQAEDSPGVTHVAFPYGPNGDPDDGQEYLRALEVAGGAARVHWWYLPDSYDEWIPAAAAPLEIEPDLKPPGGRPWRVYLRWITDSEKYNEWMNEGDYETEYAVAENKRAREAGEGEGEGIGGEGRDKKKGKKDKAPALEVAPGIVGVLGPGVVQRRLIAPNPKALDGGRVEDISHGQRQEWAGLPMAPPSRTADQQSSASTEPSAPKAPIRYYVPFEAVWFSERHIHRIEKEALPEYFMRYDDDEVLKHRNPQYYRKIRDHIISRFRKDPGRRITFVEVLRTVEADANDVRKIFDFLEKWGLINYSGDNPMATAFDGGVPPTGINSILRSKRKVKPGEAVEAVATGGSTRVSVRSGTFRRAAPQAPAVATGIRYMCNAHPWEDCTALRYHCTKIPDVDLCPRAFAEGRFPPGCSSKDFIKVTALEGIRDGSDWSDQETLLLLEGLELHGDDWAAIAEHVGGKSQLECVQRLLQLPIEDSLLPMTTDSTRPGFAMDIDAAVNNGAGPGEDSKEGDGAPWPDMGSLGNDEVLPFEESGNPVMAQIAFLTALIGPRVGAAAAQSALEALAEEASSGEGGDTPMLDTDGTNAKEGKEGFSKSQIRAAMAASLASAATKARLLAGSEEREMQRLVLTACDTQLRRINAKLTHLTEMDKVIKEKGVPQTLERAAKHVQELKKLVGK